jgi:hypothetical protein
MTTRTCRCSTLPSALVRAEPIADGFALRGNNVVSCPQHHREFGHSTNGPQPLSNVALYLIGPITASSPTAGIQIPIPVLV